jgi:serine protease Do
MDCVLRLIGGIPGLLLVMAWASLPAPVLAVESYSTVITTVQPKIVKLFGAGGLGGLEHYQTGFLVSADGHVLTVWSYVLDADSVSVVLDDGRRMQGELVGADPRLELAVLKIDAQDLPHFSLAEAVKLRAGDRVLAFGNLFGVAAGDEAASVLHGQVAATTSLAARRGAFATPYRGNVYVVDAMTNNPGAAGGALTDRHGRLAGLVGKELRNSQDNTWLNYAIPVSELAGAVDDILAGKSRPREADTARRPLEPATWAQLGILLVPDVVARTPPYIDRVIPGSPAAKADLRPDDLILFINGRVASSIRALNDELSLTDRIDEVRLVVQRGQDVLEVSLFAANR